MVKKLTVKLWVSTVPLLLICGAMAAVMLAKYGPAALKALQGASPELAKTESMSNIYGISALGLFFAAVDVLIVVRQLTNSVAKKVKRYLSSNPGVTMQQLDGDFAAAEEIGNVWIGSRWTFSQDLNDIPVENSKIVLVYTETDRVKNKVSYYLCLGLADGKVAKVKVPERKLSRIMEVYEGHPHILVGNNPEYQYMFRKDMNALLDIKYRENMK